MDSTGTSALRGAARREERCGAAGGRTGRLAGRLGALAELSLEHGALSSLPAVHLLGLLMTCLTAAVRRTWMSWGGSLCCGAFAL